MEDPRVNVMDKGSGLRQGLSIAMRLGIEMVVSTAVGSLMGYALDSFFETQPWFLIAGVFFGGAAGCLSVYRTAMQISSEEPDDQDEKNEQDQ